MENWKDIKSYEGIYQASDLGNLRSLNYKRTGKIQVLKPALDNKGYLRTAFMKDGILKTVKVHRVIAQTFLNTIDDKNQVNHINGIKTDNNLINLEWCNNTENQNHAIKIGLVKQKSGNLHHKTKHSDELIIKIYNEYKNGASKRSLAKKYNVDRGVFKRKIITNVK
jgi:hypothetical protein